jgi:uncharacterized protein
MILTRHSIPRKSSRSRKSGVPTIWIDLENTPHVPFFKPIIGELENRGYRIVLTARDAFQTCEMAFKYGLTYRQIGRHYGRHPLLKLFGLFLRGLKLIPFALREKPVLGLNHGARAQVLACKLLGIPNVTIVDYEHSRFLPLMHPDWEIVPEVVAGEKLHCKNRDRIGKYTGIKEDVYITDFKPDPSIVNRLHLSNYIIVTVRPPATEAHYHNPEAEILFERLMKRICDTPGVKAVLLPRNFTQREAIVAGHPEWFKDERVTIPDGVVDGLNLIWYSDLVVSGGGTMNREAAALGIPVYSIFRGKCGAVDRSLQAQGRLVMLGSAKDIEDKLLFQHRNKNTVPPKQSRQALQDIVDHIEAIHLNSALA